MSEEGISPDRSGTMKRRLKSAFAKGRLEGRAWVRAIDHLRALGSLEGRALLWTRIVHRGSLHQTSGYTEPDRYPELFDLAAAHNPSARRILSFGCSTGEEIQSIRRRFPDAEIVGADINPHARRAASVRLASDPGAVIVRPDMVDGAFDIVFALAVLQRQPHRVADAGISDLSSIYPFRRFDDQVAHLSAMLASGGLLCIVNAHYRVEDSRAAAMLEPIPGSPPLDHPLFGRDGLKLGAEHVGRTLFRKGGD